MTCTPARKRWRARSSPRRAPLEVELGLRTLVQPEDVLFANQLLREYGGRVELHSSDPSHAQARALRVSARREMRLRAIAAERARLRELRAENVINDETQRVIEAELDEREMLAASAIQRS